MHPAPSTSRFLLYLLGAAALLVALMVRPIASALFLAAVLSGVMWPLQERLTRKLHLRRDFSSAIMLFGVIVLLLGPIAGLLTLTITEGTQGLQFLSQTLRSEGMVGLLHRLPQPIEPLVRNALMRFSTQYETDLLLNIQKQLGSQGGNALLMLGGALSATGAFAFQATMMLIALYFFLLQGDRFVAWLDELLPLKRGQTHELITEFRRVSYAVIFSTVVTSAVQALAALVGYLVARVPHPAFFAGVTFFVAFIPAIGAAAVCLAAALLLLASGHPYAALFLTIWGVVVVGLVDNLIKPLLIKSGMDMNGAVVFFSLIGGMSAFGGIGILLGPLAAALFLALVRMVQLERKSLRTEESSHARATE